MTAPLDILTKINELVTYLVEAGLSNDQRLAFQRRSGDNTYSITFQNAESISVALKKDRSYDDIYLDLLAGRVYNAKMLDGALIQMMYTISNDVLQSHRLAFFPSPYLDEFQNQPEIYLKDEIYADVIARNIVTFPIRFDYDIREDRHRELVHPKSHLTLGQYRRCRIPVTAPLNPGQFIDFILRNFYHTAFDKYADDLPSHGSSFVDSILSSERNIIHVTVPK